MFNIMIYNITKIRIRLSICTSSEVVLSSICSLNYVTGDELDIDVSIALFRNQTILR